MQSSTIELPINLDIDYNFSLTYAYPLCVLLSDDKYIGWYYENYIKIFTKLDGVDFFDCRMIDMLNYGVGCIFDNSLVSLTYMDKELLLQVNDIVSILKYYISKKKYCILFVDVFFIAKTEEEHFAHEVLIYGFDDVSFNFKVAVFMNYKFCSIEVSYKDLEKAYSSAFNYIDERDGWNVRMMMVLSRVNNDIPYPFSMSLFLSSLKEYHIGDYNVKDKYINFFHEIDENRPSTKLKCGSEVVKDYIEYLNLSEKEIQDALDYEGFEEKLNKYGAFQMLHDHKVGMYKRLSYVINLYCYNEVTKKLLDDYKKVVELSDIIRRLFMKLQAIKHLKQKERMLNIINNLKKELLKMSSLEYKTLDSIIEILNQI